MPKLIPDWKWIVPTIRQEADGEPFEGKVGVAEVIRERMESGYNSDGTAAGTVLSPYQFSGWNTNDANRTRIANCDISDPLTIEAINAYKRAFEGHSVTVGRANLYHSKKMNPFPSWTLNPKVIKITEIGNHIFYRENR